MNNNTQSVNPCTDNLSDLEYLKHMIPHHQVAIDMSLLLIPTTNNPTMLHLCRNIIRKQGYEIWEMSIMYKKLSDSLFIDMRISSKNNKENITSKLDVYYPKLSKSNDGECNPMYFKPNDHMKHMNHMKVKINDNSYLKHMIPHHQIAIDMSKRLLLYTNNSYLMNFCRNLINEQQNEIFFMNNLLHNSYNYYSELLN